MLGILSNPIAQIDQKRSGQETQSFIGSFELGRVLD